MFYAFDRMSRTAAVAGVAAALVLLPLAAGPAKARSDQAALQLAQAARQGGAKTAAPAPSGGSEIDRQIADLKKQLKITPQQEPQFNAFADVMRSNAKDVDAQMGQGSQNPNAVEGLKQAQQFAEAQAASLKRLIPALQALYDALSDPQKKIADKVFGGGDEQGPGPGPGPGPQRGGRG
jgi:periplasmic protein CpxP/Spy